MRVMHQPRALSQGASSSACNYVFTMASALSESSTTSQAFFYPLFSLSPVKPVEPPVQVEVFPARKPVHQGSCPRHYSMPDVLANLRRLLSNSNPRLLPLPDVGSAIVESMLMRVVFRRRSVPEARTVLQALLRCLSIYCSDIVESLCDSPRSLSQ